MKAPRCIPYVLVVSVLVLTPAAANAMQRQSIATGTIVDSNGAPLEGVTVLVYRASRGAAGQIGATGGFEQEQADRPVSQSTIRSKADGTFSHPGLYPEIQYRVRYEKEGFVPREHFVVLRVAGNDLGTIMLISGDIEKARDAYDRGYSAYQSGDMLGAMEPMMEVVDVFGDSDASDEMLVVALGVLGQGYLQQNQVAEAQQVLTRLQGINPDNAIALRGLGRVYAMQGQIPQAIESFERAVEVEPDDANGRFLLGYALQLTGQGPTAVPHLRASIEQQPGFPQAHQYLGLALADSGENAEAIEHLEAYLEMMPNAPDAAQMRAKIEALKR